MTTISRYLRAAGWTVEGTPVAGASGSFTPAGVMIHHYAGSEDPARAADEARRARTSFDHSPIYNLYVSVDGRLHTITDGRANHAGRGGPFGGWIPVDQGNRMTIGLSGQCDGSHPLARHSAGYRTLIGVAADLCRMLNCDVSRVIGHKEYTTRKIDPRDNMATIRADVRAALAAGSGPNPEPTPPPPPPIRRNPSMVIQAPNRSSWLLSGERLVSITSQAAANARAGGVPLWAADSATWTQLVAAYVPPAGAAAAAAAAEPAD